MESVCGNSVLRRQNGATLVVALIILAVMSVIGVSNMKSSSMQTSMARFSENREQAFMLGESVLKDVETEYQLAGHDTDLVQDCSDGDATCFDSECTGGLCFNGSYTGGDAPWDCELDTSSPPTYEAYWKDSTLDVWDTDTRHQEGSNEGYTDFEEPKYIVEFLCYASVDASPAVARECTSSNGNVDDCVALYRVTTYTKSRDQKARVMLQSITRVEEI